MTADAPGATQDYSTRRLADRAARLGRRAGPVGLRALRTALAALGAAGALALVVSTWATVVRIKVLTTSQLAGVDTSVSGADLHGVALVVVAVLGSLMLVGALRGSRPAMVAVVLAGAVALGLIVGLDVPELDNTGQVAAFYEDVSAGATWGFYLETLGAVLLLVAGGGLLLAPTPRAPGEAAQG